MGTSPVTDRVEIDKGDVLQIDFFNIFPLFYLLYLSSIQKKEGAREVALMRRAIEAINMFSSARLRSESEIARCGPNHQK